MSEIRDLETLLAIAKQKEAQRSSSERAQVETMRILANAGGALPVIELMTNFGVSKQTIALLCDEETIKDKRQKVRVKLTEVDGVAIAFLTASGWQATGKSRGVTVFPTSDSMKHALGPAKLQEWLKPLAPTLSPHGVELHMTSGPSCQAFSRTCEALAWAHLKTQVDTTGSLGLLTGGIIPDALLIERRTVDEYGKQLFRHAWGEEPRDRDELAETTIAVEIQFSERQGSAPLTSKLNAWSAVVERLGVARRVIWIAERDAAKVLISLGVGDPARRPGQILVPAGMVGVGSDVFEIVGQRWWVLDVPRPTNQV